MTNLDTPNRTRERAAIGAALTDFGYTGVNDVMIREIQQAYYEDEEIPHGIIGMFAVDMLKKAHGEET